MRAKSIPMEKITDMASRAAEVVLAERRKILGDDLVIGTFPDIGTIGLIARNPDLAQLTATELLDISVSMTEAMRDIAPDAQPVTQIFKGGVIAGYFPAAPIEMKRLI
ncbi:MAG: hypothetical protein ACK5IP_13100 [Paracoccus sp. (in: a-proteobacteria)]